MCLCVQYHTVAHHLLIAVGVYAEIQRDDRDDHVTINWDNIQSVTPTLSPF